MKRNVERIIKEYNARTPKGHFGYHDLTEIWRLSKNAEGATDECEIMFNSLKLGYMIGYKAAMKELKKAAAAADHAAKV